MTLTLAAPNADPIRTYGNGLKVVRLTDYIGAARGTLSVVPDPYAVAAHAVKDEQTVSIPTTFASQWGSVADTVTIPFADFAFPTDSIYRGYLSVRSEGRPPVTARSFEKFNVWNSAAGPQVQTGHDGSAFSSTMQVPRENYENYSMLSLGFFGPDFDGGATDLNIRAWGIASGTWAAWYLDCLYMVPFILKTTDTTGESDASRYAWYIGDEGTDSATDDEPNTSLDIKSVLWHPADTVLGEGAGWDIQNTPDENTEFDWRGVWNDADDSLEKSYIYWVGLASRLINAHQLDFVDFSGTGPDPSPAGPYDQFWNTPEGYGVFAGTAGNVGEYYFADDVMRFRTYSVAYGEKPPSFYPTTFDSFDAWSIGAYTHNLDTFSSTDPRTYTAQMDSMESFIFTHKCIPTDGIPANGMRYWQRGERWTGENTLIRRTYFGPIIEIDSGGSATVQFWTNPNDPVGAPNEAIGASVAVPDNLGTAFWVKLEKRLYMWRFRIWLDGDPEPTDWLLEVFEPASFQNSISGPVTLEYPWETGYPGAGVTTTTNAPNSLPDETNNSTGERGWTPGGVVGLLAGFNDTTGWRFDVDDITVEYDPDSDSVGGYTGAYYHLEKYDDTVDWGTVYVAPGMCRVAFTDYAPHHFDNDTHGGNILVWKELGGHTLQTAAYGNIYFRRYVQGGVIPLFRPRVFSVSDV